MRHHPPLVLAALLLLLVPATPSLASANDLAGRWAGEMKLPNSYSPLPIVLKLTRADGAYTGTGGPNAGTQYPLHDVRVTDGTLHAEIRAPSADADVFVFDLTVNGDALSGTVQLRNQHGSWTGTATLSRQAESTR